VGTGRKERREERRGKREDQGKEETYFDFNNSLFLSLLPLGSSPSPPDEAMAARPALGTGAGEVPGPLTRAEEARTNFWS
jgi:hypothetical protein